MHELGAFDLVKKRIQKFKFEFPKVTLFIYVFLKARFIARFAVYAFGFVNKHMWILENSGPIPNPCRPNKCHSVAEVVVNLGQLVK